MLRAAGSTHRSRPARVNHVAAAAAAGCGLTRHLHRCSKWQETPRPLVRFDLHCSTYLGVRTHQRLLQTAATAEKIAATHKVFEPHIDSSVLTTQLLVLGLTVGAAAYWWYAVVPSARRTLAKEKRAGPLNAYLVDLQNNPDKKVERWFYTDWLQQLERRQQLQEQAAAKRGYNTDAQMSSDPSIAQQQQQLQNRQGTEATPTAGSKQSREEPRLEQKEDRQPSFWSLDNPILATAAILGTAALVSAISRNLL